MVRTTVSGSTPARRANASWAAALGSGAMGSTSRTSVATASATAAAATRMTCVRQQGGFSGGESSGAAVSCCDVAGLRRCGLGGMPSAVVSCCDAAELRAHKQTRPACPSQSYFNKTSPDFNIAENQRSARQQLRSARGARDTGTVLTAVLLRSTPTLGRGREARSESEAAPRTRSARARARHTNVAGASRAYAVARHVRWPAS